MGKTPPDVVEKIKLLSKATNKPVEELVKRLKEILATDPTIQAMEKEDFKIRWAASALYKEHSTGGNDCYITLFTIPRLRENDIKGVMTTVGEASGLIQKLTRDEAGTVQVGKTTYAAGTFWRDGAKNIAKCVPGKVYKSSLKITENKWGVTIGGTDASVFTEVADHKMPTLEQFFEAEIKPKVRPIGLAELDLNTSSYKTEIRILRVTLEDATVGEKDGREWGKYVVYDDTVMDKVGNKTFFFDPKDIRWMQGSILFFGGTVDEIKATKTKEKQIRYNPHFFLPAGPDLAEPYKPIAKAGKKQEETIDLDLDSTPSEKPKAGSDEDVDFGL